MPDGFMGTGGASRSPSNPLPGDKEAHAFQVQEAFEREQRESLARLQRYEDHFRARLEALDKYERDGFTLIDPHERDTLTLALGKLRDSINTVEHARSTSKIIETTGYAIAHADEQESRLQADKYYWSEVRPMEKELNDLRARGEIHRDDQGHYAVTNKDQPFANEIADTLRRHDKIEQRWADVQSDEFERKSAGKIAAERAALDARFHQNAEAYALRQGTTLDGYYKQHWDNHRKDLDEAEAYALSHNTTLSSFFKNQQAEFKKEVSAPLEAYTKQMEAAKQIGEAIQASSESKEHPTASQNTKESAATSTENISDETAAVQSEPVQPISAPIPTPARASTPEADTNEAASEPLTEQETRTIRDLRESLQDAQQTSAQTPTSSESTSAVTPEESPELDASSKAQRKPIITPVEHTANLETNTAQNTSKEPVTANLAEAIQEAENVSKTPSPIEAARVAAAIQAALGPTQATNDTTQTVAPTEQAAIDDTRTKLREQYEQRQSQKTVINAYQDRLRTRTYTYLQERYPERAHLYSQIEQQTNTRIDVFGTLSTDEQQRIHLQAVADLKLTFPDLTQSMLSLGLIATAGMTVAALQEQGRVAALGQAIAALGAAQQERAINLAAAVHANALTQAQSVAQTLQTFEGNAVATQQRLATLTSGTVPALTEVQTAELSDLRQAQQQLPQIRQALQASLAQQLGHLAVIDGLTTSQTGIRLMQAGAGLSWLQAFFAAHALTNAGSRIPPGSPDNISATTTPANRIPSNADRRPIPPQDTSTTTDAERAAAYYASRLRPIRGRALPTTPTVTTTTNRSLQSTSSNTQQPLLALRPTISTEQERFMAEQRAMNATLAGFLGSEAAAGGFEAAFNQTTDVNGLQTISIPELSSDMADSLNPEEEQAAQEAFYEQQLAEQRAQDQQARDNAQQAINLQDQVQRAKQLSRAVKHPAVPRLLSRLGMGLGAIPVAGWILLILIICLWLNIRLFFSKEGSGWREPLGVLLIGVTIMLDFVVLGILVFVSTIIFSPILILS